MLGVHFIGFDIRVALAPWLPPWSEERRRTFLLRQDIVRPASADSVVWPLSVSADEDERLTVALYEGPHSAWAEAGELGWPSHESLSHALHETRIERAGKVTVAFGTAGPQGFSESAQPPASAHLRPLGWDVIDDGCLSGLMNYGHRYPDGTDVGPDDRIRRQLNRYHLFPRIASAVAFAQWQAISSPEGAPFTPVRIYLLRVASGSR